MRLGGVALQIKINLKYYLWVPPENYSHNPASASQYESIIGALCENLDTLDEPDAKASMVWIIGEYAERIENADELLEMFIETFDDEPMPVKLTILTSMVKLFLKRPGDTQVGFCCGRVVCSCLFCHQSQGACNFQIISN